MQHRCTTKIFHHLNAPIERVYRAFTDPYALTKWLAPYGYTLEIKQLEPVKGGRYHFRLKNFLYGHVTDLTGTFIQIVPMQLVRYVDDNHGRHAQTSVIKTIEFTSTFQGTSISIHRAGVAETTTNCMFQRGWQESFHCLADLVNEKISMYDKTWFNMNTA